MYGSWICWPVMTMWGDQVFGQESHAVGVSTFPAMYGSWICWPVMTMWEGAYTDCMRFLPKDSYSSPEDYAFRQGPIQVMTYLTSRTEDGTSPIANNERLTSEDIVLWRAVRVFG